MDIIQWILVGFITGTVVGFMWREAWEVARGRVEIPKMTESRKFNVALILSFMFWGFALVGLWVNNSNDTDRYECQVEYQALSDKARDDRLAVSEPATLAEREKAIVDGDPESTPAERRAAAREYADALEQVISARVNNPYPPADYCRGR